jgi:hypothetical protein
LLESDYAKPIERVEIASVGFENELIALLRLAKLPLIVQRDRFLKRTPRTRHFAIRE